MKRITQFRIARIIIFGLLLSFTQPVLLANQTPVSYVEVFKKTLSENFWSCVLLGSATCLAFLVTVKLMRSRKIIASPAIDTGKIALETTIHTETIEKDYIGPLPDEIQSLLKEAQSCSISSYTNILLYGPHGCGKTHLVRCISGSAKIPVKAIQASDVLSSVWGESEQKIKKIFTDARALVADTKNNPSGKAIVFFDRINDLVSNSKTETGNSAYFEGIISTITQELDQAEKNRGLIMIGCTDNPRSLNSLLTCAGRFSTHVKVELPSEETRAKLFAHYVTKSAVPHLHADKPKQLDQSFRQLANITPNKTAANIREYVEEAARKAPEACNRAFGKPGYRLGIGEKAALEPLTAQGKQIKDRYTQQQTVINPGTPAQHTPTPVLTDQLLIDVISRKKAQHSVGYVADIYE